MRPQFSSSISRVILDDWESILGDLAKFGLGLISVMFDIFFLLQHYVLYRLVFFSCNSCSIFEFIFHSNISNLESQETKNQRQQMKATAKQFNELF